LNETKLYHEERRATLKISMELSESSRARQRRALCRDEPLYIHLYIFLYSLFYDFCNDTVRKSNHTALKVRMSNQY